jgi:hypothetical protein
MVRTQIQLPDDLHERARRFAAEREISLAEVTRRGIELFLDRYPTAAPAAAEWQLPRIDGGGIRVPLSRLHEVAAAEETQLPSRR